MKTIANLEAPKEKLWNYLTPQKERNTSTCISCLWPRVSWGLLNCTYTTERWWLHTPSAATDHNNISNTGFDYMFSGSWQQRKQTLIVDHGCLQPASDLFRKYTILKNSTSAMALLRFVFRFEEVDKVKKKLDHWSFCWH